jgi:hypothetical protein
MRKTVARYIAAAIWINCMFLFFQHANGQVVHEKIFVHTDKNSYQSGDIIWFRIFNIQSETQQPSTLSRLAYAEIIDGNDKPVLQSKIRLDSGAGNGSFAIPASVATGTYLFRCYTNWMKNFGAETFFEKEIAIINAANGGKAFRYVSNEKNAQQNGSLQISISPNAQQYSARQKVRLIIASKDSSGKIVDADLSVSVYRLDSLVSKDPANIYQSLFDQQQINDPQDFPFPPEYKGHFISGKMISRNTRMPSKSVTGYLSVMDNASSFYNAMTGNNGTIQFLVTKLNAADSIVVQGHSYYNPDAQLDIDNPFFDKYAAHKPASFVETNNNGATVLEQSINTQVTSLYYDEFINNYNTQKKDSVPFYYKEDMHYELDEYTRFTRIEDIFREYIRPVGVSKRQGRFHLTVFNQATPFITNQEPLVIVDGIPVFNTNSLFAYDPLKIKSVDVVTSKYFRSGASFPGIIDMHTFRGRTDGTLIDSSASVLAYEIIQKNRLFYSPTYSTSSDTHKPDFRSTLYWNPSVTSTSVEFFTSDLKGTFVITVQGIADGKAGTASATIEVH